MEISVDKFVYNSFDVLLLAIPLPSGTFTSQLVITDDLEITSFFHTNDAYASKTEAFKAGRSKAEALIKKFKRNRELFIILVTNKINEHPEMEGMQIGGWGKGKDDFLEDRVSFDLYKIEEDKRLRCILHVSRESILNLEKASEADKHNLLEDTIKQITEANWQVMQVFI